LEVLEDRTVLTAVAAPSGLVSWWTGNNTAADSVGPNNGTLNGGSWLVSGLLVLPQDISQITGQGTVLSIDGLGSAVQDASGRNALAPLTSVGAGTALAVDDASLTLAQGLSVQGVVDVGSGSGGSLTISGAYTQQSGSATNMSVGTLTATSVNVQAGSTLRGNGTVTGPVTNNGTVAPQGTLTLTNGYSQGAGAALSEQFGSTLHVNSNAALSGALDITVNPKHPPAPGATYTALTASSLTGSFTSHTAGFSVTDGGTTVQVTKE